jgi:hypothetical protein
VPRVPEIIYTNIRKVEPIGADCIRLYCAVERGCAWEDRGILIVPIAAALTSARFVIESATDIFNESQMALGRDRAH